MPRSAFVATSFVPFPVWLLAAALAPVVVRAQSAGDGAAPPARTSVVANAGLGAARDGDGLRGGGTDYRVLVTTRGVRYEPALGKAAPATEHLQLAPLAVERGGIAIAPLHAAAAPLQRACTAEFARAPGISERADVRPEGVEVSWRFDRPLPGEGDLVVRYAIDTSLPAPVATPNGGLRFVGEHGGVHVGGVVGIDANGARCAGGLVCRGGALELSLPHAFVANAAYPLVLDPLLGTVINVSSGLTYDDGEPDAAYDASTNR